MRGAVGAIAFAVAVALGVSAESRAASLSVTFDNRSVYAGLNPTIYSTPGSSLFYATSTSASATAFQNTVLAPDHLSGSGSVDTTSLTADDAYGQSVSYVGFSVDAPTAYAFSGSISSYVHSWSGAPLQYVELYTSSGSFRPSGTMPSGSFSASGVLQPGFQNYLMIYVSAPPHNQAGGSFSFALTVPEPNLPWLALGSFGALALTRWHESPLRWRPLPAEPRAAR